MKPTRVCKLLNIKYPIIQGGMGWISGGKLAAAVSNGGGLGIIAATSMEGEAVRREIKQARALTDKPFGVNIMISSPYADEVAQVVMEEGIPVLTTGAGNPSRYIKDWLAAGMQVLPVVASVRHAQSAIKAGATGLIAEGCEAGGHIGELALITLLPQIRHLTDLPLLAAGGIVSGRGVAAAFMLGAEAVQMGTCFLAATECDIHPTYKTLLLEAGDMDTMVTGIRTGNRVRSIKTAFPQELFKAEYDPSITNQQLIQMGEGSLRRAAVDGDEQKGSFMAGQGLGMVNKEQPAAKIIDDIMIELEQVLADAAKLL